MKQEDNPVEELLSNGPELIAPGEIVIGQFCGLSANGQALVDFHQNPSAEPVAAVSTQPLKQAQKGRQVALMFAEGDFERPFIIGFIHSPLQEILENFELTVTGSGEQAAGASGDNTPAKSFAEDVTVDGKKITLEAADEIVLSCGGASITLTRAGKILIRGRYLSSRSSGVNRIVGGSVQVN